MPEVPLRIDPEDRASGPMADVIAVLSIAALPLFMFGDLLFMGGNSVISHYSADVSQFFVRMREFAAAEVLEGRIPLWNPHIMSGTPFVGNWQSAVFYPPNVVYLLFPVGPAVNLDIALHLFLLGAFLYLWMRGRAIHPLGAFFGTAIVMFSGPVYLRVLAGHITMLAVMAWAPLLLASVDQIFKRAGEGRPLLGWTLIGIGATAMQMLAGHPQMVFITALIVGSYCLIRLPGATYRVKAGACLVGVAVLPGFLAAVQLFPGFHTGSESIRTGGTTEHFATLFSFPPENLLTFLAPAFFGDRVHVSYWGRWAFWDASIFMGIFGVILAIFGALHGPPKARRYAVFLALMFLFMSMGRYTPVYGLFYELPGFNMFRGPSKFLIGFVFFSGLLAGIGVDRLLNRAQPDKSKRMALFVLSMGLPIALGLFWILFSIGGYWEHTTWRGLIRLHLPDGVLGYNWEALGDDYFDRSALNAVLGLLIAFFTCFILGTLLWFSGRSRKAAYAIVILGIAEVFAFSRIYRETFHLSDHRIPGLEELYDREPGDYRVLQVGSTDDPSSSRNHVMKAGTLGIWGYEPVFLGRYGYLVSYAAGGGKDFVGQMSYHAAWGSDPFDMALEQEILGLDTDSDTKTVNLPQILDMLRCRYLIIPPGREYADEGVYENENYFPHFLLLRDYLVLNNPYAILGTLAEDTFDPRRTVVLERKPEPAPRPGASPIKGEVEIVDRSTDHMTLSVTLDEDAILLITDSYSTGWSVRALEGSAQMQYEILPANFALQAIPLTAGHHEFRVEYMPSVSVLGREITFNFMMWVSVVSTLVYALAIGVWAIRAGLRYRTKKAA